MLAAAQGSEWMVAYFFWMDILFGVGVACLMAFMYAGGGVRLRGVLASRFALWLGLFSYSIYLMHDPIVGLLSKYVFGPMDVSPLATFGLTVVVGMPVILAFCWGFHLLFEAPFLRHRDMSAVRDMPLVRLLRRHEPVTEADARAPSFAPPLPTAGERSPV